MKILLIVGNGFIHMLANIVSNYPRNRISPTIGSDRDKVVEVLKLIAYLYYELKCLDEIKDNMKANDWEEGLSRQIKNYDLMDLYNLHGGPIHISDIFKFNTRELVRLQMRKVAEKCNQSETKGAYKDLKRLFPKFGIEFMKKLECNGVTHLSIFTTNYDGVLDTLLTDQKGNFLFKDSFGKSDIKGLLKFNPEFLNNKRWTLLHSHGAYKFYNKNGVTYKIKSGEENDNPVMILSEPELKEELIRKDNVLSTYFDKFKSDLKEYDRVIILGSSFNSEPHLKEAIKEYFNRVNTELVICSNNPDKVEEQLKGFYDQFIYKFTTNDINRELDLLNLFYQLFSEDLTNCCRCINKFEDAA